MLNVFYDGGMLKNHDKKFGAWLIGQMIFCPI